MMNARISGCGAVGSALPWGGRGRWFKSSHSEKTEAPQSKCSAELLFFLFAKRVVQKVKFTGADIFLAVIYLSENSLDSNIAGGVFSPICLCT